MGRVTDLAVNEGDRVDQGAVPARRSIRATCARPCSGPRLARRGRVAGRTAASSRSRARSVALKQAQDNFNRQQDLWKGGLTTRETLERAENDLKLRQSDLQVAGTERPDAAAAHGAGEAPRSTARAFDLSKVRIESPIDGIVTRRNIEEGETVVIGTMNNAGTVLLTIADMSVIEAEVEVDETDIPTVALGQKAKVTIDAMPGKTFSGQVTEIGNSPIQTAGGVGVDAGDELSRSWSRSTRRSPTSGPDSPAPRKSRPRCVTTPSAVPIQATTVREMVVDDRGQHRPRSPTDKRRRPSSGGRRSRRAQAGPDTQRARRRVRRPGQQGDVRSGEDRDRR